MTGNQLKDILDGINVSLLRLNDRIDKLEAAKPEDKRQPLGDADYNLIEGAGWFDVGPFTVRICLHDVGLNVRIYDREKAIKTDFDEAEREDIFVSNPK